MSVTDHDADFNCGADGCDICGNVADPDLCVECQTRWKAGSGTYPDLCALCGLQAHREDKADEDKDL